GFAIIISLLLLCILSFPPLLTHLLRHTLKPSFVSAHKVVFKEWLDYFRIVFEIFFAVAVSGCVFGAFVKLDVRTGASAIYSKSVKDFNELVYRESLELRLATLQILVQLGRFIRSPSWRQFPVLVSISSFLLVRRMYIAAQKWWWRLLTFGFY